MLNFAELKEYFAKNMIGPPFLLILAFFFTTYL